MKAVFSRDGAQESIGLTHPTRPLVFFFALMPVAILVNVILIMILNKVTFLFIGVFVLLLASLAWLAVSAVETMCETRLRLTPDGLHVVRLLGSEVFSWADIQQIKLVPATRTFADDPARDDGAYLGVGLFLSSKAKERGENGDADVVLFSAAGQYTEDFMKMRDMIQAYKARTVGRGPAPIKRIGAAAPTTRKAGEFRRQRAAAGAKAS